ncbi:MAG: hypothetical protein ACTIC1_20140 [Brevibacterium sp.]
MSVTPDDDQLDRLLGESSPQASPITAIVASEISRLQGEMEAEVREATRVRRWRRPVAAALASVLVLGGATAAAAATGIWTMPWADDPVASFDFTLPSGAVCEQRIGNVTGLASDEIAAVVNFYRSTDFEALLTDDAIDATIVQRREAGEGIYVNEDGSTEPSGLGTEQYNADKEYWTAVWDVVTTALEDDLKRAGIDGIDTDLSFQGEANCPGADW